MNEASPVGDQVIEGEGLLSVHGRRQGPHLLSEKWIQHQYISSTVGRFRLRLLQRTVADYVFVAWTADCDMCLCWEAWASPAVDMGTASYRQLCLNMIMLLRRV